tara:strand:- start:2654 stop:3019 length:366 start_codon:yes stop_codon:yes gene_type:complete
LEWSKLLEDSNKVLTLTDRALERVKMLLSSDEKDYVGIRIGVKQMGCSDMSYTMDFADEVRGNDIIIDSCDTKVLVEQEAEPYIKGSELDWLEEKLQSRFVFNNPNVVGQCGCGESFKIKE